MASLLKDTCTPCTKSELDLQSMPGVQVAIAEEYTVSTGPKASLDSNGPLEFEVEASGEDYTDLSESYLKLGIMIRKPDGSVLEHEAADGTDGADINIGPSNLPLHSIFTQVEMVMNDTLVQSSNNSYPYRAYFSTKLSYGKDVKDTWLAETEGLRKDDPGKSDTDENTALRKFNKAKWKNSRILELKGRPHLDMCHQGRLIPNGVSVRYRFSRSNPAFFMMSHPAPTKPYKIEIVEAVMETRRVKLHANEQLRLEDLIAKHGARYPINHVTTKTFTVAQGTSSIDIDSFFTGQVPKFIAIGLVKNSAFNGNYGESPYNFQHFDINYAALSVDGRQIPTKGLQFDLDEGKWLDGYIYLLKCTGSYPNDRSNGITGEEYLNGSFLMAFDLTPDLEGGSGGHISPPRNGTVKASLRFKNPLPSTTSLVAFAEYDNTVLIDKHRAITFDYIN